MRLARDRIYLTSVVLSALVMSALGFFLYRDFSNPPLQKVTVGQVQGAAVGDAGVSTGDTSGAAGSSGGGSGPVAGSGGGGGSASPSCQNGTITVGQIVP